MTVPDGIISLFFFLIEVIFLIIMLLKRKSQPFYPLTHLLMFLLLFYQFMEFLMCSGIQPDITGRLGVSAFTFLPPFGLILVMKIMGAKSPLIYSPLLLGIAFSVYYLFDSTAFIFTDCNPIYATYDYSMQLLYGLYYYGIILLGIMLLSFHIIKHRKDLSDHWPIILLLGYLGFLIPMGITLIFVPAAMSAISSIMCKYAIVLAIFLFFYSVKDQKKQQNLP